DCERFGVLDVDAEEPQRGVSAFIDIEHGVLAGVMDCQRDTSLEWTQAGAERVVVLASHACRSSAACERRAGGRTGWISQPLRGGRRSRGYNEHEHKHSTRSQTSLCDRTEITPFSPRCPRTPS